MVKSKIQSLFRTFLNIYPLTWVLAGFILAYLYLFLWPIFLNVRVMSFPNYVPYTNPIGNDLNWSLSYIHDLFLPGQTPFGVQNPAYTPFAILLFSPLIFLSRFRAYHYVTVFSVLAYFGLTLALPLGLGKEKKPSALLILVFITGLFSYGFQFELERGQFNVIALMTCFLAIWIYHCHHRYRYLAYALFIISVQLKVYPLIFIVMLITDWHDWKNNIKRFLALLAANVALLFILGPKVFTDFISAIKDRLVDPYVWIGNHSVRAFITLLPQENARLFGWIDRVSGWVQAALLVAIAVCLVLIWLKAYQSRQSGINAHLLLACTIAALLIPSQSHDYTLSVLAAPVAILFSGLPSLFERSHRPYVRLIAIALTFILSIAYCSTLFSYSNKPLFLQNNLPALFVMLLVVTGLSMMASNGQAVTEAVEPVIKTAG